MKKQNINSNELDVYYQRYIDKLDDETELINGYIERKSIVISFFKSIPEDKLNYRYESEKWSIKEVFQHLIDVERIFMYRCFRIARRDTTSLSGFDQEIYIKPSNADKKSLDDLLNEFTINRNNSITLLQSLSTEDLCFVGNSSGKKMSARAAAFTVNGHDIWNTHGIKKKYL
jgi:hypothetical protein